MRHVKKILAMFMAMTMLCGVAVGVTATGVTFTEGYLFNKGHGILVDDPMSYESYFIPYEPTDEMYNDINNWLINTPYWVVDIFAPGLTTQHLENDPKANGKTIDFEITPYEGFKDTVIVADIPEEYKDVYDEFVSGGVIQDPDVTLEIKNIVRKRNSLEFDYFASGTFGSQYDDLFSDYYRTTNVYVYGVMTDKQTGEITRYDYVKELIMNTSGTYYPIAHGSDANVSYQPANINFPADFDPEKHEYGFCILTFDPLWPYAPFYNGDAPVIYNYTKIDVPEVYVEPKPDPQPEPEPTPKPSRLYGDANKDGKLNITDASLMLKYVAGWNVTVNTELCDLSGNGRVDISDVSFVLKIIAGWKV